MKKPSSKVAQKNSNPLFFLITSSAQTAQTEEFIFQNVAYRTGSIVHNVSKVSKNSDMILQGGNPIQNWIIFQVYFPEHFQSLSILPCTYYIGNYSYNLITEGWPLYTYLLLSGNFVRRSTWRFWNIYYPLFGPYPLCTHFAQDSLR